MKHEAEPHVWPLAHVSFSLPRSLTLNVERKQLVALWYLPALVLRRSKALRALDQEKAFWITDPIQRKQRQWTWRYVILAIQRIARVNSVGKPGLAGLITVQVEVGEYRDDGEGVLFQIIKANFNSHILISHQFFINSWSLNRSLSNQSFSA